MQYQVMRCDQEDPTSGTEVINQKAIRKYSIYYGLVI